MHWNQVVGGEKKLASENVPNPTHLKISTSSHTVNVGTYKADSLADGVVSQGSLLKQG